MTPDEAAATVRACIGYEDDPAYEPSDEAIRLGVQALAALDVLVAAAQRADRLAEALRQIVDRGPDRSSANQEAFFWEWAKGVARAALADDGGAG